MPSPFREVSSAPHVSSDMFRYHISTSTPDAKRWNHQFSLESLGQSGWVFKASARNSNFSDTITLGTARPTPQYYPWESMTMICPSTGSCAANGAPFRPPISMICEKGEAAFDLGIALNYG